MKTILCPECKSEKVKHDKRKIFSKAWPLLFYNTETTGTTGFLFNTYLLMTNLFSDSEETQILTCSDCGHIFIFKK